MVLRQVGGNCLDTPSIRILVVEDYEPFRQFILSTLQAALRVNNIPAVTDGLEGVREAERLQPDLILLDIGLPKLNGIEAARQIRKLSPHSKIIFVSQEFSDDIVQEAFNLGASGYVVKTDAGSELLGAVKAVLRGERFVGKKLVSRGFTPASSSRTAGVLSRNVSPHLPAPIPFRKAAHHHAVQFYSDDESFLNRCSQFIATALHDGNAVMVFTTEIRRKLLHQRLQAQGIDMAAAIDQGRYIPLDSVDLLSRFMVDGLPDPFRLSNLLAELMTTASSSGQRASHRVVACGELAPVLLEQGSPESAFRLEQLWDEVVKSQGLDTLCTYSLSSFQSAPGREVFQRICALHSEVHSQ